MGEKSLTQTDLNDLGQIIADGISKGITSQQPKKIPIGQYDPKSEFHPNKKLTPKLTRECYQNGYRMDPIRLYDEEIRNLNKINRSGRYINRRVEVIFSDTGVDQRVDIRYPSGSKDTLMENKNHFLNMRHLLSQVIEEQDKIEAQEQKHKKLMQRLDEQSNEQAEAELVALAEQATGEPVTRERSFGKKTARLLAEKD